MYEKNVFLLHFVFNNLFIEGSISDTMNFILQVIVITFLILLFGEVIPKVYANNYNLKFSKFMAIPLQLLKKLFYPISQILVNSTNLIDKRIEKRKESIQANELEHALNLTCLCLIFGMVYKNNISFLASINFIESIH